MEIIDIGSTRWQSQLDNSISTFPQLADHFRRVSQIKRLPQNTVNVDSNDFEGVVQKQTLEKIIKKYPMRITPYYLGLVKYIGDPIWKQAIPDLYELSDHINVDDPLHEEPQSPTPSIIHRYPGRVIFLVSNQCAMYCRHCMRKRKVGLQTHGQISHQLHNTHGRSYSDAISADFIEQGLTYIRNNRHIHDVILSGGDPLLLTTEKLDKLLFAIRQIDHVETIRIHTRVICTLPFRITDNLALVLEKYHPLYVNTHFNHPDELTDEAAFACSTLARAGVPLGCQTVLLKGVNDTPEVMTELMRKLVRIRVKPYYLHHPDAVAGTAHFRPSLDTGLNIMKAMRGNLPGIAIPQYVIDLPGGYGKVPVLPDYIKHRDEKMAVVENYQGKTCEYRF